MSTSLLENPAGLGTRNIRNGATRGGQRLKSLEQPTHQRRMFLDAGRRFGAQRRIAPRYIRRAAAAHLHLSGMPLKRLPGILGRNSMEKEAGLQLRG